MVIQIYLSTGRNYSTPVFKLPKREILIVFSSLTSIWWPWTTVYLFNVLIGTVLLKNLEYFFWKNCRITIYWSFLRPRHYSAWLDSQNFKLAYKLIFGGTVAFTPEAFKDVNGFSNQFWGWGGKSFFLY